MIYVLGEKPEVYDELPKQPVGAAVDHRLERPSEARLSLLAAGGVLVGSFLHYIIHGPKLPDEPGDAGKKEGGE